MLAQVVGAPSSAGSGELGPGAAVSTLAVLLLLVVTLVVLRVVYGTRRGRSRRGGPLEVITQVELAPSQSLYLVRAAGRCLLVGGTSGGLGLIAELDPAQVAAASSAPAGGSTVAERLRARFFGAVASPAVSPATAADHTVPPHRADLKVS